MNVRILKLVPLTLVLGAAALFAGCKRQEANAPSSSGPSTSAGPGGGIVSAEKNSFDKVTAKLDKGGNFYLYLSTEQALSSLSKNIANLSNVFSQLPPIGPAVGGVRFDRIFEAINNVVKDSGVEQISGFGASSIAREKGFYYNKFILHHYEGQSDGLLWSAFGKEPHALKELDLLPESTAFAAYADLDIPLVWKTIEKELTQLHIPDLDKALAAFPGQFRTNAGISLDAVLGSLGGGYGVIFTLDETKQVTLPIPTSPMQIPDPGLAIFVKVKNDAIYTRIDQMTIGNPAVVKMDQNGMKTIGLAIPIPLPISLSPTMARSGDYLFFTSSDKMLQEIVAVQTGKKSGFKSTPEFKKLSQGIPDKGNNFSLVSEKFARSFTKAMQGVASAQIAAAGSEAAALQSVMNKAMIGTNSAAAYSVSVNGSEGWEAYGNGNKSMASAAVILPAAAAGGLLAAIAIPNFVRARTMAQANAANAGTGSHQSTCIYNLRLIDSAKGQWALENHKQNTDTPTADDIRPYLGRGPAGEFPVCPDGGTYTIGTIAEKPRCSVPGHVLP